MVERLLCHHGTSADLKTNPGPGLYQSKEILYQLKVITTATSAKCLSLSLKHFEYEMTENLIRQKIDITFLYYKLTQMKCSITQPN